MTYLINKINITNLVNKKNMTNSLEKCSSLECPQECDFIRYKTYQSYFGGGKEISKDPNKDLYQLFIYYPKLEYTEIKQIAKMHLFDFISNVGGLLSIFVGCSFVTMIEIAAFVSELLSNCLTKKKDTNVAPHQIVSKEKTIDERSIELKSVWFLVLFFNI